MESRIPVLTDNIFKFYALFGLLLFIFSCGAWLYVNNSSNEIVFAAIPELEGLKQIEEPSPVEKARIALLQRRLEITKADKQTFAYAIGALFSFAVILTWYGFRKWHTQLQPVLDEHTKIQLEIAKLQLQKLQRDMGGRPSPPGQVDAEEPSASARESRGITHSSTKSIGIGHESTM